MTLEATPGPWVVHEDDEDGSIYIEADDDGSFPVALILSGSPNNQDRADARLIAAAPDLLAAVEAFIFYDEDDDTGPNGGINMMVNYDEARRLAKKAIANTKGTDA